MPSPSQLAQRIGRHLQAQGGSISLAESCTGGGLASQITAVAGCSAWFAMSWVCYSNAAKAALLGVPHAALAQGAVSQAVVEAMAQGAQRLSHASHAIAVSGIAGPGGATADKPLGTVWIAWAAPQGCWSQRFQFHGSRHQVRRQAIHAALRELLHHLDTAQPADKNPV